MTETHDKNQSKSRLINAAIAYMREGSNPTTRELAERAQVNLASISYYFQGKDNLMAQALDQAAYEDLEAWIKTQLDEADPALERLRKFALFLGRIHRNFHQIARLQLEVLVLQDRPERATAMAVQTLSALIAEHRGEPAPTLQTKAQATSIMAAIHYMSIFRTQFEDMTQIPVTEDQARDAYVLALIERCAL